MKDVQVWRWKGVGKEGVSVGRAASVYIGECSMCGSPGGPVWLWKV